MRVNFLRVASALAVVCSLASCGGDDSTGNDDAVTVLSVTLSLTAAEGCNVGGINTQFSAQSGQTVTITATGSSSSHPQFTLYEPDVTTQVGTSFDNGGGKAKFITHLDQTGTYVITVCEVDGKTGSVKILVTRPLAG